jgi:hypothetical protein
LIFIGKKYFFLQNKFAKLIKQKIVKQKIFNFLNNLLFLKFYGFCEKKLKKEKNKNF